MIRKIKYLLMLIFALGLFTGCWDSYNIEKHNIVTFFIVDYEDSKYKYYVEIANVLGRAAGGEAKNISFSVLEAEGKTFNEARDSLNRKSDNKIFRGATRIVGFTKKMAQRGIEEYFNRMRSNRDYRKSIEVVIISSEPKKVILDKPENDPSVGDSIENTLKDQINMGNSFHVPAGDVLQVLADKKVGFLLPEIKLEKEENTLIGYSVFKDAKYVGIIPAEKRKGIVYLLAPKPEFLYEVDYKNNKYQIMTHLKNKKINVSLKGEQLTFTINMNFDGQIHYMEQLLLIDDQEMKELTSKLKEQVKEDILETLLVSQKKYMCDYLGFYKYFRAYNQSKFKTTNWEKMYSKAVINVNVDAAIKGAMSLDIKEE